MECASAVRVRADRQPGEQRGRHQCLSGAGVVRRVQDAWQGARDEADRPHGQRVRDRVRRPVPDGLHRMRECVEGGRHRRRPRDAVRQRLGRAGPPRGRARGARSSASSRSRRPRWCAHIVTSLPVPAVVGMAMIAGGTNGCGNGSPSRRWPASQPDPGRCARCAASALAVSMTLPPPSATNSSGLNPLQRLERVRARCDRGIRQHVVERGRRSDRPARPPCRPSASRPAIPGEVMRMQSRSPTASGRPSSALAPNSIRTGLLKACTAGPLSLRTRP